MMRLILAALLMLSALPAVAQGGHVDPRIRIVDFNPDGIIQHVGHTSYQVAIELNADEKIQTVAVGDSNGWQVTPNGAGSVLFVKPMALVAPTNLTILTTRRRYNFELVAASGRSTAYPVFAMRFRYPYEEVVEVAAASPPPLTVTPQDQWNRAYSFTGAAENIPDEVFDDGNATFVRFGKSTLTPAIFVVEGDKQESLVNFSVRGGYVVIDRVARQLVLRQGESVTNLFNDKMKTIEPGPDAPKPSTGSAAKKQKSFRLFKGKKA